MKTEQLRLVFAELVWLETRLRGHLDAELRKEFGLIVSQFQALSLIGSREDCQVRDVADGLSLTSGRATRLIDRVESAGLCQRRPNPQDGRSMILELTPAGRSLVTEASQTIEAVLRAQVGSALSPSSTRRLVALLESLAESPAPSER